MVAIPKSDQSGDHNAPEAEVRASAKLPFNVRVKSGGLLGRTVSSVLAKPVHNLEGDAGHRSGFVRCHRKPNVRKADSARSV